MFRLSVVVDFEAAGSNGLPKRTAAIADREPRPNSNVLLPESTYVFAGLGYLQTFSELEQRDNLSVICEYGFTAPK
jgi:hypothetical protein